METSVPPTGITPRQQLLIDALATGMTITKAAEHVGIARKTAYNWLETEEFQAALADRRKELAERVAERVAELGQASVSTLLDYLAADNSQTYEPGKVKLAERLLDRMGLLGRGNRPLLNGTLDARVARAESTPPEHNADPGTMSPYAWCLGSARFIGEIRDADPLACGSALLRTG